MASKSDQDGLATGLAQQASRQVGTIAHWVSEREPGSLVTELKSFARNKPGTFMAAAAGIGLVAGRMTRGVKAGAPSAEPQATAPQPRTPSFEPQTPSFEQSIPTTVQPTGNISTPPSPGRTLDAEPPDLLPPNPAAGAGLYPDDPTLADPTSPRTPGRLP